MVECRAIMHILMRLNAEAQRYLPQDMFRASSTQPGLLWSNCCSEYSRISAAFSNNARQKSCSLKLSLFSTSTNIRGLKQWVIMKGDQWKGPLIWGTRGGGHVWTHRKERGNAKGARAGMYVCMYLGVDLEVQRSPRSPPKHPPISSAGTDWCLAGPAPLSSFVCVFCSQSKRVMAS